MGRFKRAFREEDTIVRDDANRVAVNSRESADNRLAVVGLELIELAVVDDAGQNLSNRKVLFRIAGDEPRDLPGVEAGWQ